MGDKHNIERYGEIWPQHRINAYLEDLEHLKPFVVLSGGWAWHACSMPGHVEYKHAHDHSDLDIFTPRHLVGTVMALLSALGYKKATTIYDSQPSTEDFRRYERTVDDGVHSAFKLTIDFFVSDVPTLVTPEGWQVVRPDVLLSYYGNIHSSDKCWAVQAASKLLAAGEPPENLVGRMDLGFCPDLDLYHCCKCNWLGQFPGTDEVGLPMLPRDQDLCGGCRRYTTRNIGKPGFHKRP